MKARALIVVAASAVLVSCALLSGASDLTTGDVPSSDDGATPNGDGSSDDGMTTPRDASVDTKVPGDAQSFKSCDEPGLLARWTLDEGSGSVIHDCTSLHHDGKNDGGIWTNGARDGGLSFDAGWVGFGNPSDIQLTTILSTCAWIHPEALPPATLGRGYIVAKLSDPNLAGWRLAVARDNAGTALEVTMNIPSEAGANESTGGVMTLGTWNHVCGVYSAAGSFVYVNGMKAGTDGSPALRITTTGDELRIGARSDGASPFVGIIDDVRIYSRALTDLEVKALAQP